MQITRNKVKTVLNTAVVTLATNSDPVSEVIIPERLRAGGVPRHRIVELAHFYGQGRN